MVQTWRDRRGGGGGRGRGVSALLGCQFLLSVYLSPETKTNLNLRRDLVSFRINYQIKLKFAGVVAMVFSPDHIQVSLPLPSSLFPPISQFLNVSERGYRVTHNG